MTILPNINKINYTPRNNLLPTLSRTSPFLLIVVLLLNLILSPSYNSVYLFLAFITAKGSNWVIKNAFMQPLYNIVGKKSIPLLGIGARPIGANSCKYILDGQLSKSFGMPSGHSQGAWAIAIYIICKIISKDFKKEKDYNKPIEIISYVWLTLSCLIVLSVAVYISYSRIYIEGCHTIQQVIVGSLIGAVCGFLIYFFEDDAVTYMKKIVN